MRQTRNSTPTVASQVFQRDILRMVKSWNISFSGSEKSSAENFLRQIQEHRILTALSDEEMLLVLPTLLKDIALYWFRNKKDTFRSWQEFCHAFRNRFGNSSFQHKLREQIRTRTQGEDESIANYLTCIETLYRNLERQVPLYEQLDLAFDNLRPDIRMYVRRSDFDSYEQLQAQAHQFEKKLREQKAYKPPPAPEYGAMPEVGYKSKKSNRRSDSVAAIEDSNFDKKFAALEEKIAALFEKPKPSFATVVKSPKKERPQSNRFEKNFKNETQNKKEKVETKTEFKGKQQKDETKFVRKCFNCKESGHLFKDCKKELARFCYKCGKENVIAPKCDRCAKNRAEKK